MNNSIIKGIFIVGAGLLFVAAATWLQNWLRPVQAPLPTPERKVASCPPDFLSYTNVRSYDGQVVKLISEKTSTFAAEGEFVNPQVVLTKSETENSKLTCGYLLVRAGTSAGALRPWENLYINPAGFGGHIIADEKIISKNDGPTDSTYVVALDKIRYWPTKDRKEVLNADWTALLNVSDRVEFTIGLNSDNPDRSGFIEELSIVYKCWDPKTGEENKGCKLIATKVQN